MYFATPAKSKPRNFNKQLAKMAILLGISLGLLSLLNIFSPATIFEPESTGWILSVSYANDLILPFALYCFICLGERWLGTWRGRALLTFAIFILLEFGQFLYYKVWPGHYVGVFDPLDVLMYATSVGLAVFVDQKIFPKLFKFW